MLNDETSISNYDEVGLIFPYVSYENGTISFDAEGAEADGLEQDLLERIQNDFSFLNTSNSFRTQQTCGGVSRSDNRWYGEDVYFNSCDAAELATMLTNNASISAIASVVSAFIPGGLPVSVSSGLASLLYDYGGRRVDSENSGNSEVMLRYVQVLAASVNVSINSQ